MRANFKMRSEERSTAADGQPLEPIDVGSGKARQKPRSDEGFGLKPEYAAIAKEFCKLGGTSAHLAKAFGVEPETIALWLASSREFAEACQLGIDAAEQRVERSLYERAVGYTHVTQKVAKQRGSIVIVPCKVPVPGDPRAAKILLERLEAKAALTRENPLAALMRNLEGTALRPKEQN